MSAASEQGHSPFVPQGAQARWPFVVGTDRAYRRPAWKARPLLWWGVVEALLRIQPAKPSDSWRSLPEEDLQAFMHAGAVGTDHP